MAYYLAPISLGLGDLMVSLPALQALIATGKPTYLVSRSPMQEGLEGRITGLAGMIREIEFDPSALSPDDTFYNLRNHPLQTDYIWGAGEFELRYPGYKITEVLKGICADFGIEADYSQLLQLPFRKRQVVDNAVVFVPGSAGIVKCWPAFHWLELAERLKKRGVRCLVVGEPEHSPVVRECVEGGLAHIPTPTLADALDVLSSARCVVAVDTGLMHLALQQGVPTVSLFRYNVMFQRDYPHVRSLSAPRCPQECTDVEYSGTPHKVVSYESFEPDEKRLYWETWQCSKQNWKERCMASILPEQVQTAIEDVASLVQVKK